MSITFSGQDQVSVFAAITLCSALKMYAKHGMRVNRAYTPTAMMRTAERITGQKFRARDYTGAIAALDEWIENAKRERMGKDSSSEE